MEMQYELQQTKHLALFDFADIHYLLTNDLGLRLTHRYKEITQGGTGDAIPLSHLGGAKDSIRFVTLAARLLHDTQLDDNLRQQYQNKLTEIFEQYAGQNRDRLDYTPTLVLAYAGLLGYAVIDPSIAERRLPENEEALLIRMHQMSGTALLPSFVFDRDSGYYDGLPSLRLHLTSDFNRLLEKRLRMNHVFYSSNTMYYLLLATSYGRFASGYDLSAYPLGKTGKYTFQLDQIKDHHKIDKHDPDEALYHVWTWLKQQCKYYAQLQKNPPPRYWQRCVQFCQDYKFSLLLNTGVGLFGGAKILQSSQQGFLEDSASENGL